MNERILKATSGTCSILTDCPLEHLHVLAQGRRIVIITDPQVKAAQGHRLGDLECLEIGLGEAQKTLASVESLYAAFLEREVDRNTLVVGLGGGIVCDITGFAASTYQRGLPFGLLPTTLLAQADAAIGGKNGVNFNRYKNMVGIIRQPEFVLIDESVLASLPDREYRNGLAEVVKAACIWDAALFNALESRAGAIAQRQSGALSPLLPAAVDIKCALVEEDEQESGARMLLNFGHTAGHALEKLTGMPHGEAVAIGSMLEARISAELGLLTQEDVIRLERLLSALGLPTRCPIEKVPALASAIRQDKKRRSGLIHWVLLEAIGRGLIHPLSVENSSSLLEKAAR